jgi:hypothetical protein
LVLVAAVLLVPVPALGAAALPHCSYSVKKRQRVRTVTRHGLKVRVRCDAATKVSALLDIKSRKQDRRWADLHNHGIPGISRPGITPVEAGVRATTRTRLTREFARFLRHYRKTRIKVLLGAQVPGQKYYQSLDSGKVVTLVR